MLWGGIVGPGSQPSRSQEGLVLGTLGDPPCDYCFHIDHSEAFFLPEELNSLGIEVAGVSC